jgi:hypothetical protein
MAEFQQKYAGCWCLIPNGKKPKEEIYTAYQQRNTSYEGENVCALYCPGYPDQTKNEADGKT